MNEENQNNDDFFYNIYNEKSFSSKAIDFLSYVSIFFYFTAVLLTALFIIKNHKF